MNRDQSVLIIQFIKNNNINILSSGRELNKNLCILCGYACYLEEVERRKGRILKLDLFLLLLLLGLMSVSDEFEDYARDMMDHARKYYYGDIWFSNAGFYSPMRELYKY